MEECELSPAGREHPWKTASLKRMAWAQSRDSWQAPESEEQSPDELLPTPATEHKPGPAETGPIPSKIASWLRECRTPLGASLDDQSGTPSKGLQRNGCSFEDDLSLGAEANHLQSSSSTKPDDPGFSMPAKEKRSQFRQKGRSMNSTGSGKSSGTVSSVSELLDLYEEDPEEILYNLGFGREEPDIASKIPSRFFNASSGAKGIDIKVYLGAQMQRMELENPNYALTSRFRQTEVLATVANVFSEIYSQVSGRPLQKIGPKEADTKEPLPLKITNPALNAAKILKKNLTRQNLLNSAEGGASAQSGGTSNPDGTERGHPHDPHSDSEPKLPKVFRKKDSSSPLATVTEESVQLSPQAGVNGVEEEPALVNGHPAEARDVPDAPVVVSAIEARDVPDAPVVVSAIEAQDVPGAPVVVSVTEARDVPDAPVKVSVTEVSERSNCDQAGESDPGEVRDQQKSVSSSTLDRDVCSLLPNPHMAHLLSQPRDSFEMEELQSIDGEAVCGTRCVSRAGSENLLRTASQQSDSSGFAEDPSTDGSANYLKVQESSDSCDSETTVTSHAGGVTTPVALDHPAFEKLQGEGDLLLSQPGRGPFGLAGMAEDIPNYMAHHLPRHEVTDTDMQGSESSTTGSEVSSLVPSDRVDSSAMETSSSIESGSTVTVESEDLESSAGADVETSPEGKVSSSTEHASLASVTEPAVVQSQKQYPEYRRGRDQTLSTSERVRNALLRAEQRSSSMCDDRVGRVWIRRKDLLRDLEVETRNPLRRSSSLPNSLLGPTRVVSSMRIQLGQGSVRHCTPPCYSYKYEEEREGDEVDSIAEEEDEYPEEAQSRCRSSLLVKQTSTDCESIGLPPYGMPPYPLNVPQHLTRSANSLYSAPADWPLRRLAEGPSWSTSSVPDLTNTATMPHVPPPPQQGNHHHLPHYRGGPSSTYHPNKAGSYPSHGATQGSFNSPPTHQYSPYAHLQDPSSFPHLFHTPPHSVSYPHPNMPYFHPHSAPYGAPPPMHSPYHPAPPLHAPYGSTFNLHGSPYHPHLPLSHSAPHNLGYNTAPHHPHRHYQCDSPFTPPPAQFPYDTATPSPAMSSTEMQLRRVLHEIRGTVQGLNQSPSLPREGTPLGTQSPHQPIQPLYEELQMRRRSLNVFRTQMMDLELSLMRQQSMVYQHFSPDERREAEQLLRLRTAVRQELQELELQLEDRLLTINDQLRSTQHSRLCRHPLGMSRGHSMDSLSSSSALRAMEPVSDLLREQLYLQSELGYDCALSTAGTPVSGRSSRAESPSRSTRTSGHRSPSPQTGGVYRSTVSITPSVPPRPGAELSQPAAAAESQEQTTPPYVNPDPSEVRAQRGACLSSSPQEEQESTASEDPQRLGEGGGGGGGGHAHLQQLIQEIKQSLAEEIRQEIVNELLAAVSPRSSSTAAREPPA